MKRFAFELSYNGEKFFGWQRQPKQISVQEEIEKALTKLNRNQLISVVGCGRTDTGVHAQHYVLHVDLPPTFSIENLAYKLNKMLPSSIAINTVKEVNSDFHARFDATARTYRYFINYKKDVFRGDLSLNFPVKLNVALMNEACQFLLGIKDFTSFSKLHTDVKTNICTISEAKWIIVNENELYFEIKADRFLRNMVRAIVGTMLEIGTEKIKPIDLVKIIESKNRGEAKASAPGNALFLWEIEYPNL